MAAGTGTTALRLLAAAASGVLMALCFPPFQQPDGAWFCLVPLLLVIRHSTPAQGFRHGWLSGLLFFLISLAWLWRLRDNGGPLPLVILGHISLAAYCALYTGLFGAAAAWVWQRPGVQARPAALFAAAVVIEPLCWAGAEYLRGLLLTGFPWNGLGVSQYRNTALAQVASLGGVPALSALLVGVNAGVASLLSRTWREVRRPGTPRKAFLRLRSGELMVALTLALGCWLWGMGRLRAWERAAPVAPTWRVVLVQPNAPSIFELEPAVVDVMRDTLLGYTQLAAATRPDLCIWPETALLGAVPIDPAALDLASNAVQRAGAPLLTGCLEIQPGPGFDPYVGALYFNASCLFGTNGTRVASYRKQHLVPFGEYIPFERLLPLLAKLSPIGYSCTPGTGSVNLEITSAATGRRMVLSPLICFEDILPYLARRAVQGGTRLLVNQTNDAWFEGSSEPEQHLAQAVFRCIETGVPMVRAANSGMTASIAPTGRILRQLDDDGAPAAGFLFDEVAVPEQPLPTLFLAVGDGAFGIPAAVLLIALLSSAAVQARRRRKEDERARP